MDHAELSKLVNRSGFLFQLAVEEQIKNTAKQHRWEVLCREYPWKSADHTRSGFIDFVIGKTALRGVAECKRTQGGEWIFLVSEPAEETASLRTQWTYRTEDNRRFEGWSDFELLPTTLRSEFCIVRGGSDDDKPMLERIAADVVRAAESLAREESGMAERRQGQRLYIPLILTNATLHTCRVAVADVDLKSGMLPPSAKFDEVGAVRFRKALPSDIPQHPDTYESFERGLWLKERSAVVINVGHLTKWLTEFQEQPRNIFDSRPYPWQLIPT